MMLHTLRTLSHLRTAHILRVSTNVVGSIAGHLLQTPYCQIATILNASKCLLYLTVRLTCLNTHDLYDTAGQVQEQDINYLPFT